VDKIYCAQVAPRITTDGTREYVGMVAKQEDGALTVLSLGVEDTVELAIEWCRETIRMMREMNREDVEAPDKYDRLGVVTGHITVN